LTVFKLCSTNGVRLTGNNGVRLTGIYIFFVRYVPIWLQLSSLVDAS